MAFGCHIPYASNYDAKAVDGCSDGSLSCCDFTNFSANLNELIPVGVNTADAISSESECALDIMPEETDIDILSKMDLERNRVKEKISNIDIGIRNQFLPFDDELHLAIPVVFHDVYGGALNKFDSTTRSYCNEISSDNCEGRAYRAVQILSEQFKEGNISFYRACVDEDGVIMTESDCNANKGQLIEFQDVPNEWVQAYANTSGHTIDGWDDLGYLDNVINIYVTECIQKLDGDEISCNSRVNGFAAFPSYGDDRNRGTVITTDTFYYEYENSPYNWSTLPHELGHTFDLTHIWQRGNGHVNKIPAYDIEISPPARHRIVNVDNPIPSGNTQSWIQDNYVMCAFTGNAGSYDTETQTLTIDYHDDWQEQLCGGLNYWDITGTQSLLFNVNIDYINNMFGTRCLPESNYYVVDDAVTKIINHHLCSYTGTCEEHGDIIEKSDCENQIYQGTNVHNFLSSASIEICRNLGCNETSSHLNTICTPLPGYTVSQFSDARTSIQYGSNPLVGCNVPNSLNYSPSHVIIDNTYCDSNPNDEVNESDVMCNDTDACNYGDMNESCYYEDLIIDCNGNCKLHECSTGVQENITSINGWRDSWNTNCTIDESYCVCSDQGFEFTCFDGECVNDESECFNNNQQPISCESQGLWTCPDYTCSESKDLCDFPNYDNNVIPRFVGGWNLNGTVWETVNAPYNLPNFFKGHYRWVVELMVKDLQPETPVWNFNWSNSASMTEDKWQAGHNLYGISRVGRDLSDYNFNNLDTSWPPTPHQVRNACKALIHTFYGNSPTNFGTNGERGQSLIELNLGDVAKEIYGNGEPGKLLGYFDYGFAGLGSFENIPPYEGGWRKAVYMCGGMEVIPEEWGCTDPTACNYNPTAMYDDFTCTWGFECVEGNCYCSIEDNLDVCGRYALYGCTDSMACNYNPNAVFDDGSCSDMIECSDGSLKCPPEVCSDDESPWYENDICYNLLGNSDFTEDISYSEVNPNIPENYGIWYIPVGATTYIDSGTLVKGNGYLDFNRDLFPNEYLGAFIRQYLPVEGMPIINGWGYALKYSVENWSGKGSWDVSLRSICPDVGSQSKFTSLDNGMINMLGPEYIDDNNQNYNIDGILFLPAGDVPFYSEADPFSPGCYNHTITLINTDIGDGIYGSIRFKSLELIPYPCVDMGVVQEIEEQEPLVRGCPDSNACNYNPDATENDGSCIYPLGLTTCFIDVDGNGYHELAQEINIEECGIYSCEDLGSEYATSYSYDGGGCNNNPAMMMATRGQTNIPPRIVNDSRYTNNRMVGDCNGDGWIDIHDINEVADMISTNRYDVCADTMNRNTIDKQDLINVMQHVSRHLPHDIDTMSIDKIKRWVERQDRKNNVYTMGLKVNTIA